MKSPAIFSLTVIALMVAADRAAAWCPFCDAPSFTVAEQVDRSGHVLLGKWVGGEKPTNESAGTCKFRIVEVAKSREGVFKVGDEIELLQYIAGKEDGLYSLMGPDEKLIDWHVPGKATMDSWQYLAGLPAPVTDPKQQVERLAYFIDYLEHPEIAVSNDAYAEFAAAPYDIITPLRDRLPREKLRQWIADPEIRVSRIGLYGLLLGLCGTEEDAAVMQDQILHPETDFRLGIEGVMSGYIMITREEGLQVLEDSKLKASTYVNKEGEEVKLPFSETYAAMQTLRFLWSHEPDCISKDRLKQSMRLLLSRPDVADLVITDLARWKDWGIQEQLMEMYDDEEFNIPSVKRAIVRYLYYCSQDKDPEVETLPEFAVAAAARLKVLEEKDPKFVRNTKRFLFR